MWHCVDSGQQPPYGQMRQPFFLKDDVPPSAGITVPIDSLFMKGDKPDWILQILFRFFL